ncbi:hypothetical protein B7P43_G18244 [Cryptotermes secundus]|uniref:Gustatory receptor n=2 Tax=Cryptotermes secundus TaxID=105785 RepID=A0A2J7PIL9_9NEOP|nr:hypothetical protein B7P43_G18244 [Cryptotermes secundus]
MHRFEKPKCNRERINNFYTSLKPMLYALRYVGLAPFSFRTVKQEDGNETTTFEITWTTSLYSISFTLVLCISTIISLIGRFRYTYLTMPDQAMVPDFLVWCTLSICACSSLLLGFVFRKRMARVLDTISQIDQSLLMNLTYTYSNTFLIVTTILVIVLCLVTTLVSLFFLWTVEVSGIESMVLVLPGYINYFVNNLMVLMFVCLVTLIWHRYRILNSHLTNKYISSSMLQTLNMSCNTSNSERHHSVVKTNSKDHTSFCQGKGYMWRPLVTEQHCNVYNIRKLREFHDSLHDVASDINVIYGFQILVDIAHTFIDITITLYISTVCAKEDAQGGSTIAYHGAIVNASWMLLFFLKLTGITLSCHLASNEANGTANILQKKLLTEELRPGTEREIQSFLQQVTTNKLYFSACGFFHINLSTVCAMISSVATYLVILLQS